jgi:two-component system sensor histidine kinase/response regulator
MMPKYTPSVLFLDDELLNLQSFKATFRNQFKIFTANNADEARKILANEEIEVIVSDQRMPDITGTDFFNEIVHTHPDPVRILLTGYIDIKAVIDAINRGEVYKFLTKPWNEDEVKVALNNAVDVYRTKKELKFKTEMLQKAYDELDQFVYSASHDLRAPIASLKGILNLIELEPELKDEYIDIIKQITNKMDSYVINLIQYYRGTRFGLESAIINLPFIINDIIDEFSLSVDARNVQFKIDHQITFPVKSDPIKISLILRNLIHNAIKYQRLTQEEHIVLIKTFSDDKNIHLEVTDNGTGISSKEGSEIFKMFQRATNIKSGIGLGLYIVSQCVEYLKGQIDFITTEKQGTTFKIILPNHIKNGF